jgi:GntP family gluconate:H+ symporter
MNDAYLLGLLAMGIAAIVLLTARFKLDAFFVLLLVALVVGLSAGIPFAGKEGIVAVLKEGFSETMRSIGLVIVIGSALGMVLEQAGFTAQMADVVLRLVGEGRAALAMSLTGFVVGVPLFCDSGFIVLSALNNSLARRTSTSAVAMATALSTGLYSVHCLIPPHPGATAAAGMMGVDAGVMMFWGLLLAVPCAVSGLWWALRVARAQRMTEQPPQPTPSTQPKTKNQKPKTNYLAFLPVAVPVLLIALKAFVPASMGSLHGAMQFLGEPVVALLCGLAVALALVFGLKAHQRSYINQWLAEGVVKSGSIVLVIAAGGAFGAVLKAAGIAAVLGTLLAGTGLGIGIPFVIAALLKTAQGSSTVAVITTASLLAPMMTAIGLDTPNEHVLATLAMGAGSMVVSHANDGYFWVTTDFSTIQARDVLRSHTIATGLMGCTALLVLVLASLFIQ